MGAVLASFPRFIRPDPGTHPAERRRNTPYKYPPNEGKWLVTVFNVISVPSLRMALFHTSIYKQTSSWWIASPIMIPYVSWLSYLGIFGSAHRKQLMASVWLSMSSVWCELVCFLSHGMHLIPTTIFLTPCFFTTPTIDSTLTKDWQRA